MTLFVALYFIFRIFNYLYPFVSLFVGIEAFRMILYNVLREEKQAETDATSKVCTRDTVLS